MKRFLSLLIPILCLGIAVWWIITNPIFFNPLILAYKKLLFKPCQQPINYHLGTIDPRFHLSNQQVLDTLKNAEAIWETPIKKNLFEYKEQGEISVNLTYDYRQEATDKLKSLGITLEDNQSSYNLLRAKYNTLHAEYISKKGFFDTLYKQFQAKRVQYEADLALWNASARTSPQEYSRLQQEEKDLQTIQKAAQTAQNTLNVSVDAFNAVVNALNKVAAHLNITVDQYNTVGVSQGKEYNEGLYESDSAGKRITIYEFQNQKQLVRVLAHEMGHALGLDHSDNPSDIMYRLNESKNEVLTANDIAAVQTVCQ